MLVTLNKSEMDRLFQQDPDTEKDGGFQSLIVGMQKRTNKSTGDLTLSPTDLERIPKYAFDYKQGGWENTLIAIFTRHLGSKLGR
jgi:hypothetical protein